MTADGMATRLNDDAFIVQLSTDLYSTQQPLVYQVGLMPCAKATAVIKSPGARVLRALAPRVPRYTGICPMSFLPKEVPFHN
jgi:hypothetical protein